MTTQAQGKGKKKNKEVTKLSLDEFNQIDAPHGHSVVNVKATGFDWAAAMADHEKIETETQHIIVPTLPRAQRGPGVDYEALPNEPPFRVSLFNLPMSVDESEVGARIFQGLEVIKVESSKSSTTVEFGSKQDLYEALCKDGTSVKGRTINVCLYGETPKENYSDRYGSRGGNSYGDRYGDRQGGGFGQRSGDRYGDRSSVGSYGRDRDSYSGGGGGFGRTSAGGGGFGQSRGGYGDRYNDSRSNFRDINKGQYTSGGGEPESEEPTNWRARPTVKLSPPVAPSSYNNGSRQSYTHSRSEPSHYQQPAPAPTPSQQYQQPDPYYQQQRYHHHNQPPNHSPYPQFNNQAGSNNRQLPSASAEERPKLVLTKRKTPLNIDDSSSVSRNEAIFGQAKPSSTPYQKMNEVEEKLKAVQIGERKEIKPPSQAGSQPGSAPRSRRVSGERES